jgi:hypothetical protein
MRFLSPFMQQQNTANSQSQRMKLQTTVLIQPDRRTQSVIVTAAKDMMEEISGVIKDLDKGDAGNQVVTAFNIGEADPAILEQALSGLFYTPNKPSSSSTQVTTALSSRTTANNNSQASSTTQSTTTGAGSTGTTGIR